MNEKILVVDDEEAILLGVGDLLASEGYRVSTARDGREALERFATDRPDLVLLDVMMPEMSGYDVCRAIRNPDNEAFIIIGQQKIGTCRRSHLTRHLQGQKSRFQQVAVDEFGYRATTQTNQTNLARRGSEHQEHHHGARVLEF